MANKPVIFKFEDSQTGKIYQVEGDPGSTQEEAMSYLDSLAPEDLGQYEYKAPTTAPQAAPQNAAAPVASPTDAPKRAEVGVSIVQGNVDPDYDPRWMGAEQEALVTQMMADPQYSYEDIDKYVRELARSKGLPEMGLADPPEQLAAYRESLAAGQSPTSVGYRDWKTQLNAPTPEADPEQGWLAALERARESAAQYGTAGILAHTYHDWMDTGKEQLRERFPGASEEQLEAMQSDLVAWTQKKLREANAIESEDDPLIPWLVGELIGGAGIEDFVPGGPMAGIAKRTGIAAGTNVAADAAYQGIDIASGVQDEFSGEQLALSGALGAGLHLGVEGVGATARKVRGEGRAPEPEPEEPSSREDLEDYLAVQAEPRVPGKIRDRNKKLKESRQYALDQAHEHIGEIMTGWQNAPSYEVVPTFKTLDGVDNDAVGAYGPDGKLLINLENIRNPADLTAVTYHEALGHHGLSQRFADDLDNVLTDFYDNGISTFREKVDEWLENNPNEYVNEPNRIARAAEEVLAEMSEEGPLPRTLKDRVSNFLKEIARSMGLDLKFSEREIKSILAMAHDATINGVRGNVRINGFRYSKKQGPTSAGFKRPEIDDRFKREDRLKRGRLKRSQHQSYEQWQADNGLINNTVETVTLDDGSTVDVLIDRRGQVIDTMNHKSPRGNLLPDETKPSVQEINQLRNPMGVEEQLVNLNTGEDGPVVRLYNDDEARQIMDRRTGGRRYSKKRPARTEEAEIESAIFLNQQVLDNYEPTYRSWAEGKRAARERGLTPKQIRSAKSIGELDKRMFQYDAAAEKLNNRLSELHSRMDDGTFTMRDKANYLETMFAFNEVTARIFQDQAEVARALNALKAVQYTKNKISQLNQILAEYQGNNLNAFADDATFFKFAKEVQELIEQGNTRGAENMVKHVVKPYWWQYILSFRHSMMLSGLATHAKNISDNGLMIARELEESILATAGFPIRQGLKAMGLNVKEGVSPQEAAGRLYGILRAALDAATYQRTMKAFREGHGNTPYSKKVELADVRIPVVSKVQDALHAEDVFFRSFHDNANLYSLGIRQARAEGFKGLAAFEEGSNIAMNPTDTIRDRAKELTDIALLVDQPSGPASRLEALKAIKPGMKSGEQATAFAANIIFPFFRVTDRLLFQQLRRSPLSFVDRVTREDWAAGGARRDTAVARTLMGSALIYYYWWKAGTGEDVLGLLGDNTEKEIEGNAPSWEKQQALEAGGYRPNAVIEDDKYVDATALNLSLLPNDLQNAVAANVATIRKAYEDGKADVEGTANAIGMATKSLLSILSSASFSENVSTYVAPFRENQNEGQENASYGNVIGGLGSQFIPAALRQYNQKYADPIKRDTTGDKSVFGGIPGLGGENQGRVLGRLKSGIPGLSDDLPPRYSLYGEEMEQGRTLLGMDNYQEIKQDPVSKELQRLERTTDDPVVTGAPSSFRMNDLIGIRFDGTSPYVVKRSDGMVANEKGYVKLTAEGKQEWQRVLGYFIRESMRSTILSDEWRQASDEEKIAIVKETKRDANQATKEYMLPLLGLEGFGADEEE